MKIRKNRPTALTVGGLSRSFIYRPLAVLMAILSPPVLSWMESGLTGGNEDARPFQALAQNTAIPDTTAPTNPSSLTVNLDPFVQPSGALDLSWTASSDPDSPNLTYHVESSTVSLSVCGSSGCTSSPGFSEIGTSTTTQFQDTAVDLSAINGGDESILFRVRASDPSGNYSGYSNVVQFPPNANPNPSANSIIQTYYPCVGGTCYFGYVQDLKQLESDAVNAYLAAHKLPATDAHIIYDDGRADLRNAIRGNMLAILLGIIGKPATTCASATPSPSCRTIHEQALYNWLQTLVQGNEIALYTSAISQYDAWYANPCHFTLDPQTASALKTSYDGSPWCQPGSEIPPSPTVPDFKYFMAYGMEQSYGKPSQTYPNFDSLVAGTQVNVTAVAGIFTAAGVELAAVAGLLLGSSFTAAATAFTAAVGTEIATTAGSAVVNAAYTLSASTVEFLGGAAAAAAGVVAIVLVGVAIGVAALIELLNYDNTISQLNSLGSTLTQVTTTPPDLTTFLDANGQFKLNQTLVSQTVPDIPSTATLPAHQATDRLFGVTPQNSTETIGESLSYVDWNGINWSAQTSGGWFVQACASTQGCPQTDSISADIEYIDWVGAKRMASRIGDKLVVIKQNPAPTDKSCPADQTAGVTLLPGSDCWSYVDTKFQLKAADGTLETVRLVPLAPTTTTITAKTVTYNANGSVIVNVSSAGGTPTGSVSLTVDGTSVSQALDGSGQATFSIASPSA